MNFVGRIREMVVDAVNLHPRTAARPIWPGPPPPSRHENNTRLDVRAAGAIPRVRRKPHAMTQRTQEARERCSAKFLCVCNRETTVCTQRDSTFDARILYLSKCYDLTNSRSYLNGIKINCEKKGGKGIF